MQTKDKVRGEGNGDATQVKPAERAALLRAKQLPPQQEPSREPAGADSKREQCQRDASSH
jgi:hypothetical protein